MSRHRKVKALDYDEEYDDFYNPLDDDDFDDNDFGEEDFESKYLSSGINLETSSSNNLSRNEKNRQALIDEVLSNNTQKVDSSVDDSQLVQKNIPLESNDSKSPISSISTETNIRSSIYSGHERSTNESHMLNSIQTDLSKIAIEHYDKHQWQMPLLDMDRKFREKTYYKKFSHNHVSSTIQSKLGHFMADTQNSNDCKTHTEQEDFLELNKFKLIFPSLTHHVELDGKSFYITPPPSQDEEIIDYRYKTKGPIKKQVPKQPSDNVKTARYEFSGKGPSSSKKTITANTKTTQSKKHTAQIKDLTITENHTAEELNDLTKKYEESLKVVQKPKKTTTNTSSPLATAQTLTNKKTKKILLNAPASQPKELETLTEKRHNLRQQLKRNAELSEADKETIKRQAQQTAKEFKELLKESKPRVNLVVIGHVDAGKSTLVGHLLYKLGHVTNKQMHRNEVDSQRSGKASFKYAWALDETEEERARGVTIDIALAQFETKNLQVVLLDSPGHVDFIPAVISGAAQADAALLVVDATRGEFETGFTSGGQTREHTFLVRSLGVKYLIVVVNKMDNVDWSWGRFSDIVDQLKPFLKQVGFSLKDDVRFVVCSGLSGENLTERRIENKLKKSSHPQLEGEGGNWTSMPSLLEAIDSIKPPQRMVDKPTRVYVTDIFKGMSSGVFLGAKVVSGKLENKQKLVLLPPNENCEIKQVETRDNRIGKAFAGDIVTMVATGIDVNKFYRGCILCDLLVPCHVTNRFQARIIMFSSINTILIKGAPVEVHINGTYESGEVRRLISLLNKSSGELIQKKPRCIAKNSSAIIQLRLARVVCCDLYEDNKDLGRFMMRSYGKTIAAGLITKIKSPKMKISSKMKRK